jgi:hypothetical protein
METKEDEDAIRTHMLASVKQLVGAILVQERAVLQQRLLSQSTSASPTSDDDAAIGYSLPSRS